MAYALAVGAGALLLSLAAPPQVEPARVSHDELPAVLAASWWCSVDEVSPNGKTEVCDGIIRYSLAGNEIHGRSCSVVSLDEVAEIGGVVEILAPGALDADRALLGEINSRARAAGADRIKICETIRFKRRPDGALCARAFELQPDTRWVLSSNGRWEDDADIALPREDVASLSLMVARLGPEVIARLPAEILDEPDIKAMAAIFGPALVCEGFARAADGTLQSLLIGAGGGATLSGVLVPISGPDAVRLESAPIE